MPGKRIQEQRLQRHLSQTQLADHLGAVEPRIDGSMVSRFECGVCLPTPPVMAAMCALFGCAVGELYELEELDFGSGSRRLEQAVAGLDEKPLQADR